LRSACCDAFAHPGFRTRRPGRVRRGRRHLRGPTRSARIPRDAGAQGQQAKQIRTIAR
jgi:hypothetical protein